MPKLGMEPIRREALVQAAIAEIGDARSLDVTVSRIARRAGMSPALAHHYFGSKDQMFLAAMQHILALYGDAVRKALAAAVGPRARAEAVIRAGFGAEQFQGPVVSAWLNFYVQAQTSAPAQRLLTIYQRRLKSNLVFDLRPLVGQRAEAVADTVAALIDGIYIRTALAPERPTSRQAGDRVVALLDLMIGEVT